MAAQNNNNFVFVLAPALVNQGPIDYATPDGIKLYKAGIEPLQKDLFTLEAHKFKVFLTTLGDHSMTCGWNDVLQVPIDAASPAQGTRSLLTHYGQITLEQIRAHAAGYANAQTCTAQNNFMLYTCLAASISPEAKAKAMLYTAEYFIGQTP